MKMKIKYRSHKYDINRPGPRQGHKYTKYEKCHGKMNLRRIKQHPSNI